MINKLQITYDLDPRFQSTNPLLSQCAAVKTNLGAISDPPHSAPLKYNKRVLDYEMKVKFIIKCYYYPRNKMYNASYLPPLSDIIITNKCQPWLTVFRNFASSNDSTVARLKNSLFRGIQIILSFFVIDSNQQIFGIRS